MAETERFKDAPTTTDFVAVGWRVMTGAFLTVTGVEAEVAFP